MEIQNSVINNVTVFQSVAKITRIAEFDLTRGSNNLTIPNLPSTLIPDSIRILVSTQQKSQLLGTSIKQIFHSKTINQTRATLEAEIDALKEKIIGKQEQISGLTTRVEQFDNLLSESRIIAHNISNGHLSIEDHFSIAEKIDTKRDEFFNKKAEVHIELKDSKTELERKLHELELLKSQHPKMSYEFQFDVYIENDSQCKAELSYLVENCKWEPFYDFHLHGNQVNVIFMANVTQTTGENWENVSLTLSTSSPYIVTELPELDPWFINAYIPPPPVRPHLMKASRDISDSRVLSAPESNSADQMAYISEPPQSTIQLEGSTLLYEMPFKVDILSIDAPTKVAISTIVLKGVLDLVIAPRLSNTAIKRFKTVNNSEYLLMPGLIHLYDESLYAGKTTIEIVPVGAEMELCFGTDDHVKIERELVKRQVNKKVLQERKLNLYAYKIKITNNTNTVKKAEVLDQIPVSKHEEIKVKLDESRPQPTSTDELNRLTWSVDLTPYETKTILYEFSVDSPKDLIIRGLPEVI